MAISSDEVNVLVYRYLLESGFAHSAFTFAHESLVARTVVSDAEVPPGALLQFLQKGLQYVEIETHLQEDGAERACDEPFHLLVPHLCRVKGTAAAKAAADAADSAVGGSGIAGVPVPTSAVSLARGHTGEVFAAAFSPSPADPGLLATGSGDGTGRLWRMGAEPGAEVAAVATLQHSSPTTPPEARNVAAVEWSPDGSRLATACYDGRGRVWGTDGALLHTLTGHTMPVLALQWSPASTHILTGSVDKSAIVWDAATGSIVQQVAHHAAPVLDVEWTSATQFATCGSDRAVMWCAVGERAPLRVFQGHEDEVNCIAVNPARSLLASASDDGTARLWSLATDGAGASGGGGGSGVASGSVGVCSGHRKQVYRCEWAPTGPGSPNPGKASLLATASFDGTVRLWDAATARCKATLARHAAIVYTLAFAPDAELLATGSGDNTVVVWSARDGSVVRTYTAPGGVFDVAWEAGGNRLAACCANAAVAVLDLRM